MEVQEARVLPEKQSKKHVMEKSKRLRSETTVSSCTSPRSVYLSPHSRFCWYEEDVWTEIAKFLDGKSLVKLGMANRWFHRLIMEESIWKFAGLRDLQVPAPQCMDFSWNQLYASSFDGSHSYSFRQSEKHIDWMRIGAFVFDSPMALVTENLSLPAKIPKGRSTGEMVEKNGACLLKKIKIGIWIADLQLVRCPVCNLESCEGTMQMLDARHLELFLREEYRNGSWDYYEVGSHKVQKHSNAASGGIFDIKFLKTSCSSDILNLKSWAGKPSDWQPKARIAVHAVAVNTNLQQNEGLQVKYHVMKNGEGEVVSIRISQQLI